MSEPPNTSNNEADWNRFDPLTYCVVNYRPMLAVDREILSVVGRFFSTANVPVGSNGIDVGAGPNLYPSMSMLPFCNKIELREYALPNVEWLRNQVAKYDDSWDDFWNELARNPAYRKIHPREVFAERVTVARGSVFELEPATWDIGTMFFVACSISDDRSEFQAAVERFVRALKRGAPFAAAFMLHSTGYEVNGVRFPAVRLTRDDVDKSFHDVASKVTITVINTAGTRYTGMAVATGRAA